MKIHLSLALLLSVASVASAQAGQSSDSARVLKPVTITEARAVAEVGGASAVVIKPEAMRSSPAPLMYEALRESPFIHVRQNSRGEMELSVRGSDSRQAAVILNGVPLTLGWDHRTDASLIPVTGAQRITFVRGLGSVLHGPNTLGGVIDIRHQPDAGPPGTAQVWGGAGVDENAATVAMVGGGKSASSMGGALSIRGGVAHRQRDGYSLPSGAADATATDGLRTNSDLREIDGFAVVRWDGARGRNIDLTVSAFNAERGVPPEEEISGPRLWRYPYHTRSITALSANTGLVTTPFGFGSLEVGGGLNSGRLKIENYTDRTYTTVDEEELGDERTMTARALATHSLPMGSTLRLGVTGANIKYRETLPPDVADYRQTMISAGGEIDAPVGAKTMVSAGGVFDRTTTPETGGREPGQEPFNAVGWRAGVSHEATAALRLHASASQRSRFPALREMYSGALNRFRPNPDLKPETLLGFEAGFTLDRPLGPIPDASFQVTGFRHNLDDAVVRITLTAPTRFMRVNRDRIQSTGAEMLAGFVFGNDAERSVSLTGDATIQRIKIFDDSAAGAERHPEDNPEVRGMLELGVPLPAKLRAFANARYLGKQYCLNPDTGNEDTLKGQAATDLAVERKFTITGGLIRSLRALVALDNVANSALFDSCGLPRSGRTLRVMLTFH